MFFFEDEEEEMNASSSQETLSRTLREQLEWYLTSPINNSAIWEQCSLLKEASVYFNTPLTSSAPVERLFSFAEIVNSPRRHALSDFAFEKLVLLKANMHIMH